MQEGLHDGHRDRIINKFNKYPDSFSDHELLELFLFTAVPRKDTNALAHKLLTAFGTLKRVFSATPEQLMTVNGVGKGVAAHIVLSSKLMREIAFVSERNTDKKLFSLETIREEIVKMFDGVKTEKFYFIMLGQSFERIFCLEYSGNDEKSVFADSKEIARALSVHKPTYAVMAHNHPSGNAEPSREDDVATLKLAAACKVCAVNLVDHVIVTGKDVYSYYKCRRIDYIKEKVDFEKMLTN